MAREVTFEKYSAETGMPLSVMRDYLIGRSPVKWDPRDVRPITRTTVMITVDAGNAAGLGKRPRTIPNPDYRKAKSIHVPRGAGAVDVDAIEDAGVGSVAHPAAQHVQGDAALRMVGREGMPQGFQVFQRQARRGRRPAHPVTEG